MGPVTALLALPVRGPIGALGWLARQLAETAMTEMLDPARIEKALLALEHRLETGEIDEAAFEAEEARLLEELSEMRAWRDGTIDPFADAPASNEAAPPEPATAEEKTAWETAAEPAATAGGEPA